MELLGSLHFGRIHRIASIIIFLVACQRENSPTPLLAPRPPPSPNPTMPRSTSRSQLANVLWKTSLGQMYNDYLFSPFEREQLPERALAEWAWAEHKLEGSGENLPQDELIEAAEHTH
jgi:hypothetical protein